MRNRFLWPANFSSQSNTRSKDNAAPCPSTSHTSSVDGVNMLMSEITPFGMNWLRTFSWLRVNALNSPGWSLIHAAFVLLQRTMSLNKRAGHGGPLRLCIDSNYSKALIRKFNSGRGKWLWCSGSVVAWLCATAAEFLCCFTITCIRPFRISLSLCGLNSLITNRIPCFLLCPVVSTQQNATDLLLLHVHL